MDRFYEDLFYKGDHSIRTKSISLFYIYRGTILSDILLMGSRSVRIDAITLHSIGIYSIGIYSLGIYFIRDRTSPFSIEICPIGAFHQDLVSPHSMGIYSIRDLVSPYSMGVYSIGAVFHRDLF